MKKKDHISVKRYVFYGYKNFLRSIRSNVLKKHVGNIEKIKIILPENLNIYNKFSRKDLLRKIEEMRCFMGKGTDIIISFEKVKAPVQPTAMLLLLAERDRLLQLYPHRKIYCKKQSGKSESSMIINQLLQKFKLITKFNTAKEHELVESWEFVKGSKAEYKATSHKPLIHMITSFFKDSTLYPPIEEENNHGRPFHKSLYNGLSEAATNVANHAYIAPRFKNECTPDEGENSWWMFKSMDDNYMSVVICDRGVGIPKSLKIYAETKDPLWSILKEKIFSSKDSDNIKLAIQEGKTRTKLAERGKGLVQIVDIVRKTPGSNMTIYSNSGVYQLTVKNDGELNIKLTDYSISINGTIIHWNLPIREQSQ